MLFEIIRGGDSAQVGKGRGSHIIAVFQIEKFESKSFDGEGSDLDKEKMLPPYVVAYQLVKKFSVVLSPELIFAFRNDLFESISSSVGNRHHGHEISESF